MHAAARTELGELHPLGVVPLVLGRSVSPLPTLGAGQVDDNS